MKGELTGASVEVEAEFASVSVELDGSRLVDEASPSTKEEDAAASFSYVLPPIGFALRRR